ncbi:MAG: D-glycerate dehydrogenase [Candidatus Delongbacteria bacterium]|nr:D-glycerate dehydrogenase [Candidatus Delongbacteria bacterium]MBN2836867.1 D-glycerate dehydrogenase [Candidatus Delongbacteria bacterium]
MKKVFITREIPKPALELLEAEFEVHINPDDKVLSRNELIESVKNCDAVLCLLTDIIDEEVLKSAGIKCKIFANYAVGYNNIDLKAATSRNVIITNTPNVLDNATADLAWSLLFSTARRVVEADKFMRSGRFEGWAPMMYLGMDITGKTLGVVGAGRIGTNFAKKAKAFDMKILYTDKSPSSNFEYETGGEYLCKEELLKRSDFVSLHIPLNDLTKHYIGSMELEIMKKNAILINTSRGPVVDEAALVKALKEKVIWGAGLDVYEEEPLMKSGLSELDNVVLLPHIASATIETRTQMGIIAAKNIIEVLNGRKPLTCVNSEVLDSL